MAKFVGIVPILFWVRLTEKVLMGVSMSATPPEQCWKTFWIRPWAFEEGTEIGAHLT